jgi:4-amino-4-deoxy-L-arabinose transferase-like glycosyltransferase
MQMKEESDLDNDISGDEPPADERPHRRVPAVVWWISALHVTLLLAYSVLLPTYRAPDEMLHVDLAHLFSEDFDYPAWDERDTGAGILHSLNIVQFHTGSMHLEASAALPKDDRPSINELDEQPRPRGINQLSQHPPLYYVVAGTLERGVELVTGDPIGAFDVEAWFYRLVSVLMVAPLPLIIWTIGRRLGLPEPVGIAATLVPLAIPQYLHMGSVANNDSMLILLFWLLTPVILRLVDGDVRARTAALAGLLTGLALYTKGFALVLPLWVLAALLVALGRLGRAHLRQLTLAGLTYSAVSLAFGGWWWIANLVRYGDLAPSRHTEMVRPIESDVRDYRSFFEGWGSATIRRFWGEFGWFDVHISGVAIKAATAVVIVGLVVGCARRDRVAGSPIGNRLLLAAPIILLVAVQFTLALRAYIQLGRMPGLQGRYWFGALAALAAVVAIGLANLFRRGTRWLPLAVLTGAIAMNALAVDTILGFYWGAPGSTITSRVRAAVAWAPLQGEALVVGAAVGAVIAIVTLVHLVATALRFGAAPPRDPQGVTSPPWSTERVPEPVATS